MNAGQIIAIGRPEELGGSRPAPRRDPLLAARRPGRSAICPTFPCEQRSLEGDRVLVLTREPVVAAQRITTWALEHDVDLGHFSVSQPTLEDIYLELTGSVEENATRRGGSSMSAIAHTFTEAGPRAGRLADPLRAARLLAQSGARDLHVRVPADVPGDLRARSTRARTSAACGGIPYDDFFVPGILAYGLIATTFVNMAISTAILRDQGVLKRMQGTPLPRWAYVAARIGSTRGDRAGDDHAHAGARRRSPTASTSAPRRCPG